MNEQRCADNQSRKSQSVADLLHQRSSRTKSGRSNVRSTEIVDNNSNGNVHRSHDRLAANHSLCVMTRVAHLRSDVEEGWRSSISKNDGRKRSERFGGFWTGEEGIIRDEWARCLWCRSRPVLYTDRNCQDQDFATVSGETRLHVLSRFYLLELRMLMTPIHASHEIRPSVWILPSPKPTMAATATKTAVQVP